MTRENVEKAVEEAREFIKRAEDALAMKSTVFVYPSMASGALRRQSMELTRALAEMRKP